MEKNTSALHKEAKAYLDAVRSVSASSTRIATTIDLFFGSDAGEQAMSANAYKRAVEEWEGSVSRSIVRYYPLIGSSDRRVEGSKKESRPKLTFFSPFATGRSLPRHRPRASRKALLLLPRDQQRHHQEAQEGAFEILGAELSSATPAEADLISLRSSSSLALRTT